MTDLIKNEAYVVEIKDGRRWLRVFVGRRGMIGKATADVECEQLRAQNPSRTYRVRKLQRRHPT